MVPQAWRVWCRHGQVGAQAGTRSAGKKTGPARRARPGLSSSRLYFAKPQNTSRIMLSSLSVRVSPTR